MVSWGMYSVDTKQTILSSGSPQSIVVTEESVGWRKYLMGLGKGGSAIFGIDREGNLGSGFEISVTIIEVISGGGASSSASQTSLPAIAPPPGYNSNLQQ